MKTVFIDLNKAKNSTVVLRKPGNYVAFMENISGNFVFELRSADIDLKIYGVFHGTGTDTYRVHTVQHHSAPRATSNLLIRGVFDDASQFHYTGLVKLEKKAQQSHAYQKNQNLVLSSQAKVESEPFLEIEANDVFCTHGSTTGGINPDELYYLMSRGLTETETKKLIVQGFLDHVRQLIGAGQT